MKYRNRFAGHLLLTAFGASAQQPPTWQGRLVDRQTKEPVPFGTVFVASRQGGTVASADEQFALKLTNPIPADTVRCLFVGWVRNLPGAAAESGYRSNCVAWPFGGRSERSNRAGHQRRPTL